MVSPTPPTGSPPETTDPVKSAAVELGLASLTSFAVVQASSMNSWSYQVLTPDGQLLFSIVANPGAELVNMLREGYRQAHTPDPDHKWNRAGGAPVFPAFHWQILANSGAAWGMIAVQPTLVPLKSIISTLKVTYTALDRSNAVLAMVEVENHALGRFTATARSADGTPLLSAAGNSLGHNFVMVDSTGAEVVSVHEPWVSFKAAFGIDLKAPVNPLAPILFAIIIDRAHIESHSGHR